MNSALKIKSDELNKVANLLHSKKLYVAVAHSSYYCCLLLMKHIWLYSMNGTEEEILQSKSGTHKFLIKETGKHIKAINLYDFLVFRQIRVLRDLRTDSDYSDKLFNEANSSNSLKLLNSIALVLKKY
ncbi:MAG: hypothetical protein LBK97_05790 [Prevotellaceae bacterium]|jgi:hypothetical protein|nr:hypothetical protein [Prevotellaceae bacterium]